MKPIAPLSLACLVLLAACTSSTSRGAGAPAPGVLTPGAVAQIYYWRAKPGKLEEYTRYIRDVAEPIDEEAQRHGAFLSVATYMTQDTLSTWTHMRVFILRDSTQLLALSAALDSAGRRLEPDSARRRERSEYAAGLRDRVGAVTARILHD